MNFSSDIKRYLRLENKSIVLREQNYREWQRVECIALQYFNDVASQFNEKTGRDLIIESSRSKREHYEKNIDNRYYLGMAEYGIDWVSIRISYLILPHITKHREQDGTRISRSTEEGASLTIYQTIMGHVIFYFTKCESDMHKADDKIYVWKVFTRASKVEHHHIIKSIKMLLKAQIKTSIISPYDDAELENIAIVFLKKQKTNMLWTIFGAILGLSLSLLQAKLSR